MALVKLLCIFIKSKNMLFIFLLSVLTVNSNGLMAFSLQAIVYIIILMQMCNCEGSRVIMRSLVISINNKLPTFDASILIFNQKCPLRLARADRHERGEMESKYSRS